MLSGHSLLNVESIVALGFLVALFARARAGTDFVRDGVQGRHAAICLALCSAILIVYWRVLDAPFLYDDYTHITDARNSTWHTVIASFGPVEHKPGLFFRPFGFLIYWLNYLVAGNDPRLWHAVSMVFHAVSSFLIFALCLELRLSWIGSAGAAFLFALNASSTEAVAWVDARFDPMSTGLVLASLLCVCRYLDSGRSGWIAAASLAGACAMYSKESAFCLPLLSGCLWFFRPSDRRRLLVVGAYLGTVAAILFVYRWWALGGIGGYANRFHPVHVLNGFLVRDWTILFFPVNWSGGPGWMLKIFLFTAPIVLAVCVWLARVPRRMLLGCLALTTVAALPVQHLLLIGTDLANTRVLYLLSVGWAVLWGAIFTAISRSGWRTLVMIWVLAWQVLMLRHNLAFWLRVPEEARNVCTAFARTLSAGEGNAVVRGLPQRKNGVVFLANGFPECVAMNSNVPASRVSVDGDANFAWNDAAQRIEPANLSKPRIESDRPVLQQTPGAASRLP